MDNENWTPMELEQMLRKKIIGQDDYLHDLSTCIWLHNKRRQYYLRTGEMLKKPKYNMFVIGKSGMGKTSAIQAAAEILGLSLVIEDASELRGAGWKGKQVSDIVYDLAKATISSNENKKCVDDFTIVVLDEIDKVFDKNTREKTFSPISNLLKFIEGTDVTYGEGANKIQMPTDNLLFIAIGAFDGLEDIIQKRLTPKSLGFKAEKEICEITDHNILKNVATEDLVEYGVSGQFLGRFPLLTVMNELSSDDYRKILLESEISPIAQLDNLMEKSEGVKISITQNAASHMAKQIEDTGVGARGLNCEILQLFKESLYKSPTDSSVCEYRLDYRDNFTIDEISGTRNIHEISSECGMEISREMARKFHLVYLDDIREMLSEIWLYTEEMYEPFEAEGYKVKYGPGLNECFDYTTIKNAKTFTTAALIQLFLDVKHSDKNKDMCELLSVIRSMSINQDKGALYPLTKQRNHLLTKLENCSATQIEKIRRIAWDVAYRYAEIVYELDYEQADYDDGVIT